MYEYNAEVLRVVDANTLEMRVDLGFHTHRVEMIRVLNYDAPEIRLYAGVTDEHKALGIEAKGFAETLMPPGSTVRIQTHYDKTGKYGRFLADILIPTEDDTWRNYADIMEENGYTKERFEIGDTT